MANLSIIKNFSLQNKNFLFSQNRKKLIVEEKSAF